MNNKVTVIAVLSILVLFGCGKGDTGGTESAGHDLESIAGIFSDGVPVDGGVVVIRDSNGKTFQTYSDSNGIYSFATHDLQPPYLLKGSFTQDVGAGKSAKVTTFYSFVPEDGVKNSNAIAHINSLSSVLTAASGDNALTPEEMEKIISGTNDALQFNPTHWKTIAELIQKHLCPLASSSSQENNCADIDFLTIPYASVKEDHIYQLLNSIFAHIDSVSGEVVFVNAANEAIVKLDTQAYVDQVIPDNVEFSALKVAKVESAQNFNNLPPKIENEIKDGLNPGQIIGAGSTSVTIPSIPADSIPASSYVTGKVDFDAENNKASISLLTESQCPISITSFRVVSVDNILTGNHGKLPDLNNFKSTQFDIKANSKMPDGNFEVNAFGQCLPFSFEYEFDYALNIRTKLSAEMQASDGTFFRTLNKDVEACIAYSNAQTENLITDLLLTKLGTESNDPTNTEVSYKVAPMRFKGAFSSADAGFQVDANCVDTKTLKHIPLNDTGVTYFIGDAVGDVDFTYNTTNFNLVDEILTKQVTRPVIFPVVGTETRFSTPWRINELSGVHQEPFADAGQVPLYESQQDANLGKDTLTAATDIDGKAGFVFTKLDRVSGTPVLPDETDFGCVQDEITGLTWENKTSSGDPNILHKATNAYSWYDPDASTNGGFSGQQNGGACAGPFMSGDTLSFKQQVNESNLCGHSDWRLPTVEELRSLVDYERPESTYMVDENFFPNLAVKEHRWTSQTHPFESNRAYGFHFYQGVAQPHDKACTPLNQSSFLNGIVLVRGPN